MVGGILHLVIVVIFVFIYNNTGSDRQRMWIETAVVGLRWRTVVVGFKWRMTVVGLI